RGPRRHEARRAGARARRGRSVSATETHTLIEPHGRKRADGTAERPDGVESLEQTPLTSRELSDLDMLASGALSPLEGFMGRDDYQRVLEGMRLAEGLA